MPCVAEEKVGGEDPVGGAAAAALRRDWAAAIRAEICWILACPCGVFAEGQVTQSANCRRQASISACRLVCEGTEPAAIAGVEGPRAATTADSLL